MKSLSTRTYVVGGAIAIAIVVVLVIIVAGGGSSESTDSTAGTTTTSASASSSSTATTVGEAAPSGDPGEAPADPGPGMQTGESGFQAPEPAPLPLDVAVSNTDGLSDGDVVSVHVTPHQGSSIFGVEAFLCRPDTTYRTDSDVRPTQTGKCITAPLSANSIDYIEKAVAPPYDSADLDFRVGVGTNEYTSQEGEPVSITCGPGNPCNLVLKLQVPDSYGFMSYPITYA